VGQRTILAALLGEVCVVFDLQEVDEAIWKRYVLVFSNDCSTVSRLVEDQNTILRVVGDPGETEDGGLFKHALRQPSPELLSAQPLVLMVNQILS
jgi:hypothetical protein